MPTKHTCKFGARIDNKCPPRPCKYGTRVNNKCPKGKLLKQTKRAFTLRANREFKRLIAKRASKNTGVIKRATESPAKKRSQAFHEHLEQLRNPRNATEGGVPASLQLQLHRDAPFGLFQGAPLTSEENEQEVDALKTFQGNKIFYDQMVNAKKHYDIPEGHVFDYDKLVQKYDATH